MARNPDTRCYPRPAWAKWIGGASVLIGLLSMPCGAPVGCVQNRVMNPCSDIMEQVFPLWYRIYATAFVPGSLGAAFLLIASGALLLGGDPIARKLHILYAWLMLSLSVLNVLVVRTGLQGAIPPDVHASMSIGAFIGLVWGTIYPIFLLCWFARRRVQSEVLSWAEARRQGKRPA
jgi:hypothetical protein